MLTLNSNVNSKIFKKIIDAVVPKPKESGNTQKACVIIQAPSEFSRFFVLFKKNLVYLHRDWVSIC